MASYETKRIFAQNLNRLLDDNRITQLELSTKMGVAASTVSSWCNGEKMPRMDKVEWMAEFFGVPVTHLIEQYKPSIIKREITDDDIQFALFGGNDEITEKMYDEVKKFAAYIKQREGYNK